MDSLIEYLEFNDYDVRLAAARSLKFLSSNKNIKAKLRDNMVVTSKMVIGFLILLTEQTEISVAESGQLQQAASDYLGNVFKYTSQTKNENISDVIDGIDSKREEMATPKAYRFEVCLGLLR